MNTKPQVSHAFLTFGQEAPGHQRAWMETVHQLDAASKLDKKTGELAYIAVLAAVRLESGIPFHVKQAKALGASREEVLSAVPVGLPAIGNGVISSLPIALQAFDEE